MRKKRRVRHDDADTHCSSHCRGPRRPSLNQRNTHPHTTASFAAAAAAAAASSGAAAGHQPTAGDDPTNSFISTFSLAGAPSGPLAGRTVAVKDLFE